ncbi:probable isocitrate dehydrogenase [NAD] subunit alpha, mitochondrial [Drosophila obscura]|uniref:probable isocitrate dehydrogenase [NAD] subunit alpha, mitochondrial n=1 Tax=Drosophila obscura TaxID=7282 RepID=UPI001BB13EE1|nr:probable isocitrate dehydrogenase [NAD] subunit alpha, mitochondrial [Drosophila obscura]
MNIVRKLRSGQQRAVLGLWQRYASKDHSKNPPKDQSKNPPKDQAKNQSKDCGQLQASSICGKSPGKSGQTSKGSGKSDKGPDKGKADANRKKITMIDGDGVGPELTNAVLEVCCAAKVPIDWDIFHDHRAPDSEDVAPQLLESLCRNKMGISGPIKSRQWADKLRKELNQFAYVSVCHHLEGQESPYGKFDCVIVRDQFEGEYSGIEHRVVPGVMQTIKVSTSVGATRLAKFVFDYALKQKRKKITVAHKANIMQLTDGNFLEAMHEEADKHVEKVRFEERYLDTVCLNMLMRPEINDILVSSSMYGDVISTIGGSMMGGIGMCPGYAVSPKGLLYNCQIQPCECMAGKDLVNPTGLLLATVLMLRELKLNDHATSIQCAIQSLYKDSELRTQDLDGKAKCSQFVQALCEILTGDAD